MNNNRLTQRDAFKAMVLLLEHYFKKCDYEDLISLLGSMAFLQDEGTANPAIWDDWIDAIKQINPQRISNNLSYAEAFEAVRQYLENYQAIGPSPDVAAVLANMYVPSDRITVNPDTWKIWLQCVDDVKAGKGDFYLCLFKP